MRKIVYTIGHSNRGIDEFIRLIKYYNVKTVVDVRRFPSSSKYPHFEKNNLIRILQKENISYVWLGNKLGGFRKGGYVSYMFTEEYMRGINELEKIINKISEGYVAIMCAEKLWFKCHRRFISDTLAQKGYLVLHLLDFDKTCKHKLKRLLQI